MHLLHPFTFLAAVTLGALSAPLSVRQEASSDGTVSVQTPSQGTYVGLSSDAGDQVSRSVRART